MAEFLFHLTFPDRTKDKESFIFRQNNYSKCKKSLLVLLYLPTTNAAHVLQDFQCSKWRTEKCDTIPELRHQNCCHLLFLGLTTEPTSWPRKQRKWHLSRTLKEWEHVWDYGYMTLPCCIFLWEFWFQAWLFQSAPPACHCFSSFHQAWQTPWSRQLQTERRDITI